MSPFEETLHHGGDLDEVTLGSPVVVEQDMGAVASPDNDNESQCQENLWEQHLLA